MRRGKPELLVATLFLLVLGWYVWYTQRVVVSLRADAQRSTDMYRHVFRAVGDTTLAEMTEEVFALTKGIQAQGVPLIVTDLNDRVIAAHANLPCDADTLVANDDPCVRNYLPILKAQHRPIVDPRVGRVYFGDSKLVRGLTYIPAIQALTAAILLFAALYIIRTRGDAQRERLWAGMARESAHQLGTPLSSLAGWIELLEERAQDEGSQAAVRHMGADLERLDRVAHRFERIGRDPKFEEIDVAGVVNRIAKYFQARVPTLANTIQIEANIAPDLHVVHGDAVLLEWAVEVLTKNAIDALAGRGGWVKLSAERGAEESVVIRVADNGPGIPREIRTRVFEPGFSTKKSGWGIGLSLAKRIVEENHGGKLILVPSEQGATFEIILTS
jgi:signal transduction histidine kinase